MRATLLKKLAAVINERHLRCERAGGSFLLSAIRAGRQLAYVKKHQPHGEFEPWIKTNMKFSLRTARRYRQLALRMWPKIKVKVGNRPHVAGLESVRAAFAYVEKLEKSGYSVTWVWEPAVTEVPKLLHQLQPLGIPEIVIPFALERLVADFAAGVVTEIPPHDKARLVTEPA